MKRLRTGRGVIGLEEEDVLTGAALVSLPLSPRHNLPAQPSSFVGREEQTGQLLEMLAEGRLVTLAGPGGVGKTRLALRTAELVASNYADGTWFVELSNAHDRGAVTAAVVAAVPWLRRRRGQPAALTAELAERQTLLILDNCEQVRADAAEIVHELMRGCAQVSVLATSRRPLGVTGEQLSPVEPLPVPCGDAAAAADAAQAESVRLFVDRARCARPDFQLDAELVPPVAAICRRLDGLPLAIELAAARIAVLSPAEILARLDDRFRLLTARGRVTSTRHRSLASALESSHALLAETEAALFARLGVFAGAWDLEAAEEVCSGDVVEADEVLDILSALVAQSLVVVDRGRAETRFRMLETVRCFARGKLEEAGNADAVAERHARWCIERAEEAVGERGGTQPDRWLDQLEDDHDDFRAALGWARRRERADIVLTLGGALSWFWETRGHLNEGLVWLRWALDREPHADAELQARALRGAGILTWIAGDAAAAMPLVDEAVVLFRTAGNEEEASGCVCASAYHVCANPIHSLPTVEADLVRMRGSEDWGRLARSLVNAGVAHFFVSDAPRARACFEECLGLPKNAVEGEVVVDAYLGLGRANVLTGDLAAAEVALSEALRIARQASDADGCSTALGWIGEVFRVRGEYDRARTAIFEATDLAEAGGLPLSVARSQQFLARLEASEGDLCTARNLFTASLDAPGAGQMPYHRVRSLQGLADIALVGGEAAEAGDLVEEAMGLAKATGDRQAQGLALAAMARIASLEGDAEHASGLAHEGLQLQERIGDVVGIVGSLETLAELAAASGRPKVAARLFGAAQTAREARGFRRPALEEALDRHLPGIAELVDDTAWAAAVSEGSSLSPEEAVSYAVRGRGSKDRPATGWDSLTRAERDIATLVADGMSNREIGARLFVSARTVATHLSHIYRKVPVANRRELTRAARKQAAVERSASG